MSEPRTTDSPGTPGFVLRNGAILLAEKDAERAPQGRNHTVVLAFTPGRYQPFVVWSRDRSSVVKAERDVTYDGDYYESLDEAVAAYKLRRR